MSACIIQGGKMSSLIFGIKSDVLVESDDISEYILMEEGCIF